MTLVSSAVKDTITCILVHELTQYEAVCVVYQILSAILRDN
jgi:hypothetical protein